MFTDEASWSALVSCISSRFTGSSWIRITTDPVADLRRAAPAFPVNVNLARRDVPSYTLKINVTLPEPSTVLSASLEVGVGSETHVCNVVPPLEYVCLALP